MRKNGFTLIELLTVLVILAVLLIIAIPKINDVIVVARENSYENQVKLIEAAGTIYIEVNEEGNTSVEISKLLEEGYLKKQPVDPRTNDDMTGSVTFVAPSNYVYAEPDAVVTANAPVITTNMYPVKWNGTNWIVVSADDSEWYIYNGDIDNSSDSDKTDGTGLFTSDKWANVHVTTSSLSLDDTVPNGDLNMYVWIPRYTYRLDESAKTIEIKYSVGTSDDTNDSYISHPGFTFGIDEVNGIWVAKFEMSSNTGSVNYEGIPTSQPAHPVSRPSVIPWSALYAETAYLESLDADSAYFSGTTDLHLSKSNEWSAATYLTEAIRDGEEVWINNFRSTYVTIPSHYTGCAGTSVSAAPISFSGIDCPSGYDYDEGGMKASTTGNINGIYDMSGGVWEFVASYIDDSGSVYLTSINDDLYTAPSKHKNWIVSSGTTNESNYIAGEGYTIGLGLHEVSTSYENATAWYGDTSSYIYREKPIVLRGGRHTLGSGSGIFAFASQYGKSIDYGFRSVIVVFN